MIRFSGVWNYDPTVAISDPGAGNFLTDEVAVLSLSETDEGGTNHEEDLGRLVSGDALLVQRVTNATEFYSFTVTGTPTDNGVWWEIPVAVVNYSGQAKNVDYLLSFEHTPTTGEATWITDSDVDHALGGVAADHDYLDLVVAAANAWAFRRRATAGYVDDPVVAPDAAAHLGTTLYAVALYKERGSVDSYASFEELAAGFTPVGTSTQINRLLGIGKPVAS